MKKKTLCTIAIFLLLAGCGKKYDASKINEMSYEPGKDLTTTKVDKINDELSYVFGVDKDNMQYYDKLLRHIDEDFDGNYKIESLYSTVISSTGVERASYIIKAIPDEYKDAYESWTGTPALNPYNFMYTMGGSGNRDGKIESSYEHFLMENDWHEKLDNQMKEDYPDYHVNVNYSRLLSTGTIDQKSWEEFFATIDWDKDDLNTVNLFLPAGTTEEQRDEIIKDMAPFFQKYYIQSALVITLDEGQNLDEIKKNELIYQNSYYFDDAFTSKINYAFAKNGSVLESGDLETE